MMEVKGKAKQGRATEHKKNATEHKKQRLHSNTIYR